MIPDNEVVKYTRSVESETRDGRAIANGNNDGKSRDVRPL